MRFTMFAVLAAALAAGLLAGADDAKKNSHKCPLEKIMCPFSGDCEGQCRTLCDKGGEGLAALHASVAAAVKSATRKDADAHVAGTCKAADCAECGKLNARVFGPAVKARVSARFGEMGKSVKHTVKDAGGRESQVECTFLTGKLCDECVKIMAKDALERLEDLRKTGTK